MVTAIGIFIFCIDLFITCDLFLNYVCVVILHAYNIEERERKGLYVQSTQIGYIRTREREKGDSTRGV